MASLRTKGIVCAVRPHAEHSAVVRLFTPEHGLMAGYVRGARSREKRPILIPSNVVEGEFRARTEEQLPSLTVELSQSRGPYLSEPLAAAALDWSTALSAATLPEAGSFPQLYKALSALLDAICFAPSARGWTVALVRYELLLLSELGFGLDLSQCVATGSTNDLRYVSPKSAAAVSGAAGEAYREKLLPLPKFLLVAEEPNWADIFDGLSMTGFFLERSFFAERRADVMASRQMLVDRLKRAVS